MAAAEVVAVELVVNGSRRTVEVPAHATLLETLRGALELTGTKECCAEGECGACTVIVDGRSVNSCLVLAAETDGAEITTVEGLATGVELSPLQRSFLSEGAVQCGFCIPGMVVSATHLLDRNPSPSLDEVKEGLSGNLCRCGGYLRICSAVLGAAGVPT